MTKILRVVFYIRVSTEEQKMHGFSLDAQYEKLNDFAKKHKYKVVHVYKDEGISGRKEIKKRPQLQQLLKDAQKNMFDLILFIKLDRYFRSVGEYHECQKILDQHNVSWTATEEKYDLTTANGRAFVNMKLTIAELEADQTSERIKLVNEFKVKEGYALSGAVPFGWTLKRENGHSKVIRDPKVEHIVYEALDHFERFNSIKKTINDMYDKYELNHTYKVLRNTFDSTFLYGSYRGNDNFAEPYISKERYEKIQEMLKSNYKETKKNRIYLFSNLITCGNCGTRMTGNYTVPNKRTQQEFYTYRCNSVVRRVKCPKRMTISEKIIEQYLLEHINEKIKEYIIKVELEEKKNENKKKISITPIQNEIDRLNIQFRKGRIEEDEYDAEYDRLFKKLIEAQNQNKQEKRNLEPLKKLLNSDLLSIYNILDREHKRSFWKTIIEEIILQEDRSITFTLKDYYI